MIDEFFLNAVKKVSELAKQEGAPLLLLVFCRGLQGHQLLLNDSTCVDTRAVITKWPE
jgi:hypothetical protein